MTTTTLTCDATRLPVPARGAAALSGAVNLVLFVMTLMVASPAYAFLQEADIGVPAAGSPGPAPLAKPHNVPDFSQYTDVREKKRAFFEFMLPLIREANQKIRSERNEILVFRNKLESVDELGGGDHQRLKQLFTRYRMQMPQRVSTHDLQKLLERVDVVPASLVLAQSANESGWGTSRFAVEANNYFGIWCFSKGCGLVPNSRTAGMNHEVARYDTVLDGVRAYLRNINTHAAYEDLRVIRAEQREMLDTLEGQRLAEGLVRYSERGEDYVREIQSMIRVNSLERFTETGA